MANFYKFVCSNHGLNSEVLNFLFLNEMFWFKNSKLVLKHLFEGTALPWSLYCAILEKTVAVIEHNSSIKITIIDCY